MSAMGLKITNFHYSNMTMPQANLTEYPKWVKMSGYAPVIAQDAEHEAELLAREPRSGDITIQLQGIQADASAAEISQPTNILAGPNDERDMLIKIAEEKGIRIDLRWKTERIRATLDKACPIEDQA